MLLTDLIPNQALPKRVLNALWGADINTIDHLISHTRAELKRIKNLGECGVIEIEALLTPHGLKLREVKPISIEDLFYALATVIYRADSSLVRRALKSALKILELRDCP